MSINLAVNIQQFIGSKMGLLLKYRVFLHSKTFVLCLKEEFLPPTSLRTVLELF